MTLNNRMKRYVKRLFLTPRGAKIGKDSFFRRPWRVLNADFVEIGDRTRIHGNVLLNPIRAYEGQAYDGRISIGNDVYVGRNNQIHAIGHLKIGDGSVISEYVYISDSSHGFNPSGGFIMDQPLVSKGPILIGRHVFLGYGSLVLPGCELGDHSIVGAHSMVTRSFPAYSMLAGAPARLIKIYDHEEGAWIAVREGAR